MLRDESSETARTGREEPDQDQHHHQGSQRGEAGRPGVHTGNRAGGGAPQQEQHPGTVHHQTTQEPVHIQNLPPGAGVSSEIMAIPAS